MSNLSTLPKGDSAWLLRKAIERIIQQVSVLETNIGASTSGNSANTQIIFNDNGTLRGDAGLVYNKTTDALTVAGLVTAGSATITGDLTVDTSTLKVDATNNRVGINNASPGVALHIGTTSGTNKLAINTAVTSGGDIQLRRGAFIGFSNAADGANAEYLFANGGALEFGIAATTAMTLDSTGLGIGASPSTRLHISNTGDVYARIATTSVAKAGVQLSANGSLRSVLLYDDNAGTTYLSSGATFGGSAQALTLQSGTSLQFYINNQLATANMTLDASGNLLIGTTSNTSFSSRIALSYDSGVTNWAVGPSVTTPTGFFISANVGAQGVYLANSTATSWTAWSDERLKDIIEPINNAVFKVGSLRAVIGKFKNDTTNTRKPFLIAQDVLAVLPEAVDVSNPDSFGVSYTDVIPLLVAAIKELTTRVQTLEDR